MAAVDFSDLAKQGFAKMKDPAWRLLSGELYKIIVKDENDPDAEGLVLPFKPNRAQRRFISRLHHRNIILKARQLGFTTLIAILWLDFALFNANARCGIIAQDDGTAQQIFKDKVKFAYDNLPQELRDVVPLKTCNAHEMEFAHNGSSIRVATSMRGGTYHRLHVSEFGKICAKYPAKANEVVTGSIPTVPISGILVIESTAEGQQGAFYEMTQAAIRLFDAGKKLTPKEYRFHFYGWWFDDDYRMPPDGVIITKKDLEYFLHVETTMQISLDTEQRAWYLATRKEFEDAGKGENMLQEYPSTPNEAFQRSIEGTFYAKEMAIMRKTGRICRVPVLDIPCNTFWDIGNTAGTAIWIHQKVGLEHRFIKYIEGHNESYAHYVHELNATGFLFNKHFLPHDAEHRRQGQFVNASPKEMLEELGLMNVEIVPVVSSLDVGIQLVRKYFPLAYIDEVECADGIKRLDGYKRKWDNVQGTWRGEPEKHDGNSEGSDGFRQWAQALDGGLITLAGNTKQTKATSQNWKIL
jgi:hypothetical protein